MGNTFGAQQTLVDRVTPTFDTHRLDVLIHLLALRQLDEKAETRDRSTPSAELFNFGATPDWVARSMSLSLADGEQDVGERLRSVLEHESETVVGLCEQGLLQTGAVDAAISMHLQRPSIRTRSSSRTIDRSVRSLRDSGWSQRDLRTLLHSWATIDSDSTVVILDATHDRFDDLSAALRGRFVVLHSEFDFISSFDRQRLEANGQGSAQTILISGRHTAVANVLSLGGDVALATFMGQDAPHALSTLWDPGRPVVSNSAHRRRVRRLQLRSAQEHIFGLVRKWLGS